MAGSPRQYLLHQRIEEFQRWAEENPKTYRQDLRWKKNVLVLLILGILTAGLFLLLCGLGSLVYLWLNEVDNLILWADVAVVTYAGLLLTRLVIHSAPIHRGIPVTAEELPTLFRDVDDISNKLNTLPVHHIVLTGESAIGLYVRPTFSLLFRPRFTLLLGVPLLMALSPEQTRAIIAQTLCRYQSTELPLSHSWHYQLQRLQRALETLETAPRWGSPLLEALFRKQFNNLKFLSNPKRLEESQQADRLGATLGNPDALTHGLIMETLVHRWLDGYFWSVLDQRTVVDAIAPKNLFSEMAAFLKERVPDTLLPELLAKGATVPNDDEHAPSLKLRLYRIIQSQNRHHDTSGPITFQLHYPTEINSAQLYLEPYYERVLRRLDKHWFEYVGPSWEDEHTYLQGLNQQRQYFEAALQQGGLPPEALWEYISLLVLLKYPKENIAPLAEKLLTFLPDFAPAHFLLGSYALEQGDPSGVNHLKEVLKHDEEMGGEVYDKLIPFYKKYGNENQYLFWQFQQELWETQESQWVASVKELQPTDSFRPAFFMAPDLRQAIAEICSPMPQIDAVYVVQKQDTWSRSLNLVVILYRKPLWNKHFEETMAQTIDAIQQLPWPRRTYTVGLENWLKKRQLTERFRNVVGSRVYTKRQHQVSQAPNKDLSSSITQ